MICRCTRCNKDFFVSDNTLYLRTGLCVHCRNSESYNRSQPTYPPVQTVQTAQRVVPQKKQSASLSTVLLFSTLIVTIAWVYVLPYFSDYEKSYISDYNDLMEVKEKNYTIKYTTSLPYAQVIVEDGVVVGYDVKEPYISTPQQVFIPYGVTEIADYAFANFYGLVGITFNESLERVGKFAFSNCYNLEYVSVNDNLKSIDDYAFAELEITKITLPKTLDYLGVSALNKVNINTVTLPADTRLGSDCLNFNGYSLGNVGDEIIINNLYIKASTQVESDVIIPDGVTSIEDYAFYSSDIESVYIPEGVTYIGPRAFMLCPNLQEVTFPSTLIAIDEFAFYNCKALTKVNFNENLKVIAYQAFAGTGIDESDIPSSVKILDESFL